MLDIAFIRENEEKVKKGMLAKGEKDTSVVDRALEIDTAWRNLVQETDKLRNSSNLKAKKIGELMGKGKKEEAKSIIEENSAIKEQIKGREERLEALQNERIELLLRIPNVPHESVPIGTSPEENEVYSTWGEQVHDDWRKPHWELVESNNWIDFKRGVKVTGAGFPFYTGSGAKLQRALINFFLDSASGNGYRELQPPYMVNEDSARGTGQIPDKEDMMYTVPRDEFYMIPTAEVPVTNYHREEILEENQLPLKYAAYTPCWRREAGSYGKDVRGLNRLHQFDKVELVKIVHPDSSYKELESLRNDAEILLQKLKLPYRTLLMCTGDMGFTQAKKYDLEVWSPGQKRWLEVSSCSNFEAFQARRMMLRYRDKDGHIHMAHTLNGSGLALPRVVSAILEVYQQKDGRVAVPEALKSYLSGDFL